MKNQPTVGRNVETDGNNRIFSDDDSMSANKSEQNHAKGSETKDSGCLNVSKTYVEVQLMRRLVRRKFSFFLWHRLTTKCRRLTTKAKELC
jgi:hypothetical protein